MKIEDNRRNDKCIMFKDLEVGRVFEHVDFAMIMIKLDDVIPRMEGDSYKARNALRIGDTDLEGSSTSVELWHISPESRVIPVEAKLVIEE